MTTTQPTAGPALPTREDVDAAYDRMKDAIDMAARALMGDVRAGADDLSWSIKQGHEAIAAQDAYREIFEAWWHETLGKDDQPTSGHFCYRTQTSEARAR